MNQQCHDSLQFGQIWRCQLSCFRTPELSPMAVRSSHDTRSRWMSMTNPLGIKVLYCSGSDCKNIRFSVFPIINNSPSVHKKRFLNPTEIKSGLVRPIVYVLLCFVS